MLMLNIFGWSVSVVVFVLICVGALVVILATLGLLVWLCCCCMVPKDGSHELRQKETHPHAPYPPGVYPPGPYPPGPYPPGSYPPGSYPPGSYPPSYPPATPQHMAVPVDDTAPLTPVGSAPRPPSPRANDFSPAAIKKWEEQLQATLFRKMSLEEVRASTGYFNRRYYVGEGAFAVVYKGLGPNGVPWAVKRSKQHLHEGSAGEQDFENEVIGISRLSHKHLVRLLGYCMEDGEHILVYEYCPNGSLSSALYAGKPDLSFLQRLDVAIGTAEALYYLHSASSPPIIHRDVKPDNVFLDSQLRAKLGDFGLLKKLLEVSQEAEEEESMPSQPHASVYTRIAGTPGYLDPEYHLTSKVTAKGDVYSFGVLLLQLCTGQRAILPQHPKYNDDSALKNRSASNSAQGSTVNSTSSTGVETPAAATAGAGSIQPVIEQLSSGSPAPHHSQTGGSGSRPGSSTSTQQRGSIGSSTAFAALEAAAEGPAGTGPGEPIHISTWLAPYVKAKVVEPVADSKFGNNYNKLALFRMLEIGLLCVQPAARKRPAMSVVSRWLHEVREELEREVEEPEGQYSSVFAFDRDALEGAWRGEDDASQSASGSSVQQSAPSSQQSESRLPSTVESALSSSLQDDSVVKESAKITEGR